jgi:hypothetical protein
MGIHGNIQTEGGRLESRKGAVSNAAHEKRMRFAKRINEKAGAGSQGARRNEKDYYERLHEKAIIRAA